MGLKRQEKELTFAQRRTLIRDITLSQLNIWKIGGDKKTTNQKEMKRYVFYNAITSETSSPKRFLAPLFLSLLFSFASFFSISLCHRKSVKSGRSKFSLRIG